MRKLLHRKNKYSDEEFENEELENDEMLENEELDNEEEIKDSEEVTEDKPADRLEEKTEEIDDSEESENSLREENSGDEEDSEGYEKDSEDEDEDDSEDDEDDSEDEDEWGEDERRAYRRRRRIRNQIIAYSVVIVFLAAVAAGGVYVGRNIVGIVKEKRLAEEQARLQEQLQAEQEAEAARDVVIDAPETIDIEPEADYLGDIVESQISSMPLEDKVAGLFIVTPEAITGVTTVIQAGEGTQDALNEYAVGGLIYFDQNIVDEEQLKKMLSSTTSKSRYPIFLAVDEEGGSVSRVAKSSIEVIQVGDMASIGENGDTAQAYEAGLTIGSYLKNLGFNLDFAPVADVAGTGQNAMGNRVFGSDARMVGDMVANVVEGIEGTGVSSCLKHFPGIGYAEGDTHDGRVETDKTLDEMRSSDFIPFKSGIDAGAGFVMVSHITVTAADEEAVPSTLSKTIMTDVLRNELGFQGVIITDALNMGAITEYYTAEEAATQAIIAGADMLLMPEDFYAAYNAVLAAVQDGRISEERIDESLERIYRVKFKDKLD